MKIEPTNNINTNLNRKTNFLKYKDKTIKKDDSFESILLEKLKESSTANLSPRELLALDGLILNDDEIKVLKSILDKPIL